MKKAKDNGQAVQEFMVAVNAINDKLELLSEYMDDHMAQCRRKSTGVM